MDLDMVTKELSHSRQNLVHLHYLSILINSSARQQAERLEDHGLVLGRSAGLMKPK